MQYENWADVVMVVHVVLIFLVLGGILISARYKRFRPVETLFLLSAIIIWSLYGGCPLTYLENNLRLYAGSPIPLAQAGFIPYYLQKWFDFPVTVEQLRIATYVTAFVFLLVSIDWVSPYINIEIFKFRKFLKRLIRK